MNANLNTAAKLTNLFNTLWNDDAGFIVSAELVLVATIGVISLVVGLSEVAFNVNQELEDVGSAFGSINQTYMYKGATGAKGKSTGSVFWDFRDDCDGECDLSCDSAPQGEDRG